MNEYALLVGGVFNEVRYYAEKPVDIPHKYMTWHDVVRRYGAVDWQGLENNNWVIQTPDPATLPPPVPSSITPRQCRLILLQQGLLASVEAMILEQGEAARVTWEYALEFQRTDPLLNRLAAALSFTDEQIDQFFIAAAQI